MPCWQPSVLAGHLGGQDKSTYAGSEWPHTRRTVHGGDYFFFFAGFFAAFFVAKSLTSLHRSYLLDSPCSISHGMTQYIS